MLTPGPGVPPLWPSACLAQGPRFPPRCGVFGGACNLVLWKLCGVGLRKLGVKPASDRQSLSPGPEIGFFLGNGVLPPTLEVLWPELMQIDFVWLTFKVFFFFFF